MPELVVFIIAGVVSSAAQFVLYKFVLPKFYKDKKVPTYWQIPIPVLLFLISNTLYKNKSSLMWMFIAYIGVYAILTIIFVARIFKQIDEETENNGK